METQRTPGSWNYACDSYGKVQHSKKACVYVNTRAPGGDRLDTVAARIPNWADARLIAAAPDLLAALQDCILWVDQEDQGAAEMIAKWRAVISKATSGEAP